VTQGRERQRLPRPNLRLRRFYGLALTLLFATLTLPVFTGGAGATPAVVSHLPVGSHGPAPSALHASSPAARPSSAAPKAAGAARPSIQAFNPPCYPIVPGICVSIANPGEPDIIPTGGNHTASVMPTANESLPLVVKSHDPLNHSGTDRQCGPNSNMQLNVTGILWNGDPYMSKYDDSVWHSDSSALCWQQVPDNPQNNATYPWWYSLNISATDNGHPNFFAGEQVTWWVELTNSTNNQTYLHHEGPHLTYIYSGAWPYSPYPGSPHFAGPAATQLDVNLSQSPRVPNWNDSVRVTVNTTQADVAPYNASIGGTIMDLVEVSHDQVIYNTSFALNVSTSTSSGFGNTSTSVLIPASYAQIEGANVSYRLWISDDASPAHQLVSPWISYTVGGNGSFANGIFASDLFLQIKPVAVLIDTTTPALIQPGLPVNLTLQSRTPTDAILAAEVQYTITIGALNERITRTAYFSRVTSIDFVGAIPGLPLGTNVTFTIFAWDFEDDVDQSSSYSYTVETFAQDVGPLAPDLAFFFVYVYDNGSHSWVQDAIVQIEGPNNEFNSLGNTTFGETYANRTGQPFSPLLLKANTTYNVTVTDLGFVPGGRGNGPAPPVSVNVALTNPMTADQPLASTPTYLVLQQGDQILFYLNATAPSSPASPSSATASPTGSVGEAAILGVVAATLAAAPIYLWWRQIKARRTQEEKRVTL
jgi:hypothetical protein